MVQKVKISRIQVPLTDDMREAYQTLADAQRTSLAAVCAEILEQAAPMVRQIASALETAKTAPSRALRDMAGSLEQLTDQANQLQINLEEKVTPKATRRKYIKRTG